MSERVVGEKSDGKLINQLRSSNRSSASQRTTHTCSAHPSLFSRCERSHSRRPALSPALRRVGMKRCGYGERVRPSGGESGDADPFARQLMKKRAKKEREKNNQVKAVLFIFFSPLRVFFRFVESRSSRRDSGPRLRDFSLCEPS